VLSVRARRFVRRGRVVGSLRFRNVRIRSCELDPPSLVCIPLDKLRMSGRLASSPTPFIFRVGADASPPDARGQRGTLRLGGRESARRARATGNSSVRRTRVRPTRAVQGSVAHYERASGLKKTQCLRDEITSRPARPLRLDPKTKISVDQIWISVLSVEKPAAHIATHGQHGLRLGWERVRGQTSNTQSPTPNEIPTPNL
jgi:hypothetical protein